MSQEVYLQGVTATDLGMTSDHGVDIDGSWNRKTGAQQQKGKGATLSKRHACRELAFALSDDL